MPKDVQKHLRALRLRDGDQFDVCDGKGNVVTCALRTDSAAGRNAAQLAVVAQPPRSESPPSPAWTLAVACGSLKGGRADWLVEKAAELGAAAFAPLVCERSREVYDGRLARWERLARAASEQSLRAHALVLREPIHISDLAREAAAGQSVLVAAAGGDRAVEVLASASAPAGVLVVGPEGDLTPGELATLRDAGATAVGLGPSRLRVESAALALLSVARMYAST